MQTRSLWKLALVAAILLWCVGCVSPAFVTGVDAGWQVIGPEYKAYVKADKSLDADSQEVRLRTADLMTRLIKEAQQ